MNKEYDSPIEIFLKNTGILTLNTQPDGIQLIDSLEETYLLKGRLDKARELLSWLGLSDDNSTLFDALCTISGHPAPDNCYIKKAKIMIMINVFKS